MSARAELFAAYFAPRADDAHKIAMRGTLEAYNTFIDKQITDALCLETLDEFRFASQFLARLYVEHTHTELVRFVQTAFLKPGPMVHVLKKNLHIADSTGEAVSILQEQLRNVTLRDRGIRLTLAGAVMNLTDHFLLVGALDHPDEPHFWYTSLYMYKDEINDWAARFRVR